MTIDIKPRLRVLQEAAALKMQEQTMTDGFSRLQFEQRRLFTYRKNALYKPTVIIASFLKCNFSHSCEAKQLTRFQPT